MYLIIYPLNVACARLLHRRLVSLIVSDLFQATGDESLAGSNVWKHNDKCEIGLCILPCVGSDVS